MNHNLPAKIEAFLFARGEATSITLLVKSLGASKEEVEQALAVLEENYTAENRGLIIIRGSQEEVSLGTRPEFAETLRKLFGQELRQELTPAALETLAIIVYRGPISRPEIDEIRGVNSTFMVRNLMIRGLAGREPDSKRRNVWKYEVTLDCLKMLGVSRREDLPDFETLSTALNKLEINN
jgi:segregation and condensation protein B